MNSDHIIYSSHEYDLITKFYENRTATRSKVPLINHINEGLQVIYAFSGALTPACTLSTMKAFCLHPIIQADGDLKANFNSLSYDTQIANRTLALALEYRNIANAYLSKRVIKDIWDDIILSPLPEVNVMLIADKIQNYKDFLLYHKTNHTRAIELEDYFENWLARLGIDYRDFEHWFIKLQEP